MREIFNKLVSLFRKSKQFPKPFLGISWEEFSDERKEIKRILKLVNDFKIISRTALIKHPNPFFKILSLSKEIEKSIVVLDENSSAIIPLKKLKYSCNRFMADLATLDVRPAQYHEIHRNFSNSVKIQCAVLLNEFWIELDENYEQIQINTSLV